MKCIEPSSPTEHKTVQARILAYAQEIAWRYVPRAEAEARRGFDPDGALYCKLVDQFTRGFA